MSCSKAVSRGITTKAGSEFWGLATAADINQVELG